MSGGHFDYKQHFIEDIADSIQEEIDKNNEPWFPKDTPYSWEQRINSEFIGTRYSDETIKEFKNAVKYLRIAHVYAQRVDWLLSGDDSEEYFHKRLKKELDELETK